MMEKPAVTLLHCGPGLANGLANLHNARRARSGIVNCVGDQATYHRPFDAPLTADTESLARTVSQWVRTSTKATDVGADAAAAVQARLTAPGQVATMILPSDTCWDEGGVVAKPLPVPVAQHADPLAVRNAARILREKKNVLILLGGTALREGAQALAWRASQASGAKLLAEGSNARVQRGQGRLPLERVPYPADVAIKALSWVEHVILVNAKAPVGFFAYPDKPSKHYPETAEVHVLTRFEQDPEAALRALCEELGAPAAAMPNAGPRPESARGAPTPEGLARTVAAVMRG